MAIKYFPSELLKKVAPEKLVKKLVSNRLTVNKAALSMIQESGVISKKALTQTTLKVMKGYRQKFEDAVDEGASKSEASEEVLANRSLLVNRVQNRVVFAVSEEIGSKYKGERYIWLPSDAEEPDPLHQLNYGLTFRVGKGEMPGERYGCKCGMQILVAETELSI